jgi:spoIIIJ-associated protein
MSDDLEGKVIAFLQQVVEATGLPTPRVEITDREEGLRVNVTGDDLEILLKRKGAALDALQHITNAAFRSALPDKQHIVVDCQDYRRGKDAELRQMAKYLGERAKSTGVPQEIGPLNPYARRLVHLAVAEDPTLSSESVGDAFLKTVIIASREG